LPYRIVVSFLSAPFPSFILVKKEESYCSSSNDKQVYPFPLAARNHFPIDYYFMRFANSCTAPRWEEKEEESEKAALTAQERQEIQNDIYGNPT